MPHCGLWLWAIVEIGALCRFNSTWHTLLRSPMWSTRRFRCPRRPQRSWPWSSLRRGGSLRPRRATTSRWSASTGAVIGYKIENWCNYMCRWSRCPTPQCHRRNPDLDVCAKNICPSLPQKWKRSLVYLWRKFCEDCVYLFLERLLYIFHMLRFYYEIGHCHLIY